MAQHKDLVSYMCTTFGLTSINWAMQMRNAKLLLSKFTYNEVIYALNHYKNNGVEISSLGFLTYKNFKLMAEPVSLFHAEINLQESDKSGERNRNKIERIRKTECGKNDFEYLFAESNENV